MEAKVIKTIVTVFLSLLIICLMPASVMAIGLGVGPSDLTIENAMRGGVYERAVTVFNSDSAEGNFSLSASEAISSWVVFYGLENRTTPIQTMVIPAQDKLPFLVRFTIPADAADSVYQGQLFVTGAPPESAQSTPTVGNKVQLQMPVNVTIRIAGTARLEGKVTKLNAKDTVVGSPVNLEVGFANTGNVEAMPKINVKVSRGDQVVADFAQASQLVKANAEQVIRVPWETRTQSEGDYSAQVEVTLGDKVIESKKVAFKLLPSSQPSPEATAAKAGTPVQSEPYNLKYEGRPALGTITRILAVFRNTEAKEVRARFAGEVFYQDKLVATLTSEELVIAAGKEDTITAYFRPEQPGDYKIAGYVNYEGKRTPVKEVVFKVTTAEESDKGSLPLMIVVVGGAVALGAAAIYWFGVSRRNARKHRD